MTQDDVVQRSLSVYGKQWVYLLGAKPDPRTVQPGSVGVSADCTGFIWWATGRPQSGRLAGNPAWRDSAVPVLGSAVWHDARPPAKFGHAGLVIKVHPDGDFDTLDCSSTPPGPRGGAIRLLRRSRGFWTKQGTSPIGFWVPRYVQQSSSGFGTVGALALAAAAAAALWWYASARQT